MNLLSYFGAAKANGYITTSKCECRKPQRPMDTLQLANANAENEGAKDFKLFYPVEAGIKCSALN